MSSKEIQSRIIHKHDTEENWNKATNFIPKQGELIVYDADSNYSYERFKIGDGIKNVSILPFATNFFVQDTEPIYCPNGTMWIDTSVEEIIKAEGELF